MKAKTDPGSYTSFLQTCVPTPRLRGPSDLWHGSAEVCCVVHIQEGNTELLVGQLGYGVWCCFVEALVTDSLSCQHRAPFTSLYCLLFSGGGALC